MDDIEAVLEIELSAALREEFKLMLKTYNRYFLTRPSRWLC